MSSSRRVITIIFALGVLLAGIPTMAQQSYPQQRVYRGTYQSVRNLINRIDSRATTFRNTLDTALAQSRLEGTNAEENINLFVRDFEAAVDRLRERFESRQSTAAEAQEVLEHAALIDRFVNRRRLDTRVQQDWSAVRLQLNQLATAYGVTWPTVARGAGRRTTPFPSSRDDVLTSSNVLTGTYRLDASRSDDPREAASRATQSLPYRDRQRVSDEVTARLEAPDQMAIEVRGRRVTIASSRAPQISFDADGSERVEQTQDGRNIRARATLSGDQLIVSSNGDRLTDFSVTFDPIDNGRRLSVTRRVYVNGLPRPVVVQSTYDKTADVARFDIQGGGYDTSVPTTTGEFIIPNGESLIAELNEDLSTRNARDGQTFTATVRQPSRYEGAIIEGRVTHMQRGGRVTGRSGLTLTFDNVRMRDGRTYRFAGILEGVRMQNGEVVNVDNEGAVQDDNQTTKTVQRTAIGTAIGAIIGAIAGGGKGAAIGAIVGAGGGAGSVYVQGRDDLDLMRGTQLTIRASGPQ